MSDSDRGDGPKKCLGGRYDLLDRVGIGGGAVVVRVRDRQIHRLVAVKLLRAEYLVDAIGVNKISGQPFKVAEIEQAIAEHLA